MRMQKCITDMDVNRNYFLTAGILFILLTSFYFLDSREVSESDLLAALNNDSEINNLNKLNNTFEGSLHHKGVDIVEEDDYPFLEKSVLLLKPGKTSNPYLEIELPAKNYEISTVTVSMRNGAVLTNQPVQLGGSDCGKSKVELETSSNLNQEAIIDNRLESIELDINNSNQGKPAVRISLEDLDNCGLRVNEALSIEEIKWGKH